MIRNSNLYVSSKTMRALRWAAKAREVDCADTLAEQWLTERLLAEFPTLQGTIDVYERNKKRLEDEAVKALLPVDSTVTKTPNE